MAVNEKEENQVAKNTNGTKKVSSRGARSTTQASSLKKKLEQAKREREELRDRLMRKAAEFDNYRKRTEGEFSQVIANANADLIVEILPILDDSERFLKSGHQSNDFETLYSGFELIYKNLAKLLEKRGVKAIEAIGKEFDPEKHDALMQVENNEHGPNVVVDEHLRGYEMNERVLRHSQVLVSK